MKGALLLVTLLGGPAPTPEREAPLEARPAAQQDQARAEAAWQRGVAAYQEGRLAEAIEAFEETYRHSGRAGPLFSLGQTHRHRFEQDGDPRQRHLAITRYQQYLELEPEGARALEAERYIAELLPLSELELEGPGEAPIFTRLSLASAAPGATVSVDGEEPRPLPATPDVTPGAHRVVVRAPGYEPWTRDVVVPEGSTVTLEVTLQERLATLTIDGPAGAELYVDGRRVGPLRASSRVSLTPGRHQIGVAKPGRSLFVRELVVERGEQAALAVDLETTGQRKVAYAALAVGGGALASSAALLGVTLDAQRRALAIEAARFEGSITAADEQARVDLVARRDSLRAATVATGVTGLALLTSGVILLLVDRPAVRSRLHGPGELARRVSVAPGLASLTLRAEF